MRKFFILALMVASLMMVSCVERRNRVILEKFIPITDSNNCEIKVGGDTYYTEGKIDLAFTFDYLLAFQITNYIPASDGGNSSASLTTGEANYFYADEAEIEYEWFAGTQDDGRKLNKLNSKLWDEKKRVALHDIVVKPDGGQAAGFVHIFEEAQIKDLLEHVHDIDWVATPLVVKLRIIGKIADGTKVKTNKMNFAIIPTFGTSIQMGSVYPRPKDGYQDTTDKNGKKVSAEKQEYDMIMSQCAFNDALIGGCFPGQDSAMANCYAGDTEWERFITEQYCESESSCYIPGYAAAGVVEMVYRTLKKNSDDDIEYVCCPGQAPEAPEEEEEEENANTNTEQTQTGGE